MTTTEGRGPRTETADFFSRVNRVVRRVIGAPDYTAYVKHMKEHHPECSVMTEAEFLDDCLTARYSTPGSRCC